MTVTTDAPALPAQELAARHRAFREDLVAAGHLVPLGPAGLQGWSGDVEDIRAGISRLVVEIGRGLGAQRRSFPALLTDSDIAATGYLGSFPQLIGSLDVFSGSDRDHRALLHEVEAGEDWTGHLSPAGLMMVSAACHPLYAALRGTQGPDAFYELKGACFRHEPSEDPFRNVTFHQHEVVAVGTAEHALGHRERSVETLRETLAGLGLDVHVESANDPFFGRAGKLLAAGQRDGGFKVEFTVAAYGADAGRTAIASVNLHEDHFGTSFDLKSAEGTPAHTACFGFGVERIALALLRTHGLDVRDWDTAIRERLGLR